MLVRVQDTAFDLGQEVAAFAEGRDNAGAIVTFSGIVRGDGGMTHMEIEHYPGMTERALQDIAAEATRCWSLEDSLIIHRHGSLAVGDIIMMVATAARHRKDAFEAAEYLMDYLKSRAPFWKKEHGGASDGWVAAKDDDEAALDRW